MSILRLKSLPWWIWPCISTCIAIPAELAGLSFDNWARDRNLDRIYQSPYLFNFVDWSLNYLPSFALGVSAGVIIEHFARVARKPTQKSVSERTSASKDSFNPDAQEIAIQLRRLENLDKMAPVESVELIATQVDKSDSIIWLDKKLSELRATLLVSVRAFLKNRRNILETSGVGHFVISRSNGQPST
jgi:hypothetical protein